ncbi:MAG: hypothetical protein IIB38_09190 [Candidatus Hydrogenedentes bacterium]|nr:hypothetical protein [Candidatus Hydrogenedentota bacterium]
MQILSLLLTLLLLWLCRLLRFITPIFLFQFQLLQLLLISLVLTLVLLGTAGLLLLLHHLMFASTQRQQCLISGLLVGQCVAECLVLRRL